MKMLFIIILLYSITFAEGYFAIGGGIPATLISQFNTAIKESHNDAIGILEASGYQVAGDYSTSFGATFCIEFGGYFSNIGNSSKFGILGGYAFHGTGKSSSNLIIENVSATLEYQGKVHEFKVVPNFAIGFNDDIHLQIGGGATFAIDKSDIGKSVFYEDLGSSGLGGVAQTTLFIKSLGITTTISNKTLFLGLLFGKISSKN